MVRPVWSGSGTKTNWLGLGEHNVLADNTTVSNIHDVYNLTTLLKQPTGHEQWSPPVLVWPSHQSPTSHYADFLLLILLLHLTSSFTAIMITTATSCHGSWHSVFTLYLNIEFLVRRPGNKWLFVTRPQLLPLLKSDQEPPPINWEGLD